MPGIIESPQTPIPKGVMPANFELSHCASAWHKISAEKTPAYVKTIHLKEMPMFKKDRTCQMSLSDFDQLIGLNMPVGMDKIHPFLTAV